MNTVVKICGLRRPEDAARAVELGARFLGVVLAPDSPRCASLEEARAVRDVAGDARVVLVFRNADRGTVLRASAMVGVDTVQVHGAGERDCAWLQGEGLRVIRVHALAGGATALPELRPAPTADRLALLDAGRGGSGTAFDWDLLGGQGPAFTLVAGGITPNNVRALLVHRPWGIDVSSGVERAPGQKDHARLAALFAALQEHDGASQPEEA